MKIIQESKKMKRKQKLNSAFSSYLSFSLLPVWFIIPPFAFPHKKERKIWRIPPTPFLFSWSHVPLPPHYVIRLTYPSFPPDLFTSKKKSGKDSECATLYGKKRSPGRKKGTFLLIHPSFVPLSLSLSRLIKSIHWRQFPLHPWRK